MPWLTTSQVIFSFSIHTTLGTVQVTEPVFIIFIIKGTKSVARAMKQTAQEPAKWEGVEWFSQLTVSPTCALSLSPVRSSALP